MPHGCYGWNAFPIFACPRPIDLTPIYRLTLPGLPRLLHGLPHTRLRLPDSPLLHTRRCDFTIYSNPTHHADPRLRHWITLTVTLVGFTPYLGCWTRLVVILPSIVFTVGYLPVYTLPFHAYIPTFITGLRITGYSSATVAVGCVYGCYPLPDCRYQHGLRCVTALPSSLWTVVVTRYGCIQLIADIYPICDFTQRSHLAALRLPHFYLITLHLTPI